MRSPSVCRAWSLAVATILAGVLASSVAHADDKQVCSDAYDKTQSLRRGGRLQEAAEQALVCGRESCARFVRVDCLQWLGEIEAAQPTVILEARDADGRDLTDVSVSVDGELWRTSLDGKAHAIDPGTHRFRFTAPGRAPADETIVLREGEKQRRVAVTIGASTARGPLFESPLSPPSEPPAKNDGGTSLAPWVIGGVGAASVVVGGVLAIVVAGEKSTFDEHCDDASATCDAEGIAAGDTGRTLGPISTVTLLVGAVGVSVATVWLIAESASGDDQTATLGASPDVSNDRAGLRLRGRF